MIEPDTRTHGVFLAHGIYRSKHIITEGESRLEAFIEYTNAAREILLTDIYQGYPQNVQPISVVVALQRSKVLTGATPRNTQPRRYRQLNDVQKNQIMEMAKSGLTQQQTALKLGLHQSTISRVLKRDDSARWLSE